jgi:ribosomal-protein-alanine N-acetyltransferase
MARGNITAEQVGSGPARARRAGDTAGVDAPILTERLRLRPFDGGDVDALHAMWSDPEVGRCVGGTHTRVRESVDELSQHLRHQERHGYGFWAVEERDSGRLIGEVGLMLFEGRGPEVEVGWAVISDVWGRGYATEAAAAWIDVGFERLGLDRIIAVVLADNIRSRRLCERLGMTEAGTRHAYGQEHVLYELTRRF